MAKAKEDFSAIAKGNLTQLYGILKVTIGARIVDEASRSLGMLNLLSKSSIPVNLTCANLTVSHREPIRWPVTLNHSVEIQGNYKQGKDYHTIVPNTFIPKNCDIYFVASTNVPRQFDVYWQVVNTGEEARSVNGLRGGIYPSKTLGVGG